MRDVEGLGVIGEFWWAIVGSLAEELKREKGKTMFWFWLAVSILIALCVTGFVAFVIYFFIGYKVHYATGKF